MSRTRHYNKLETSERKRKKTSFKQRYVEALRLDDWYIEIPVSKNLSGKLNDRRKAWS